MTFTEMSTIMTGLLAIRSISFKFMLSALLSTTTISLVSGEHSGRYAVAVLDSEQQSGFRVEAMADSGGVFAGAVAWGEYKEDMNQTGWSWLEIHTNASFTNSQQAIAAGVLEGELTHQRLDEFLCNTGSFQDFGHELKEYLRRNMDWVTIQVEAHGDDPFWHFIGLAYDQLKGVLAGYNAARQRQGSQPVDWDVFYALTLAGDLDDLCEVFACHGNLLKKVRNTSNSHCSALIRIADGDVFVGHSTWSTFESMTRIYKLYNLAYTSRGSSLPGHAVAFPSYPGVIVSIDDFYQTSAGLVVMETTNANANADLWKRVVPESLLYWVRAFVSNLLTDSGPAWAHTFSKYNSGTYNNQWMVVDTKVLLLPSGKLSSPLKDHSLTVTELLPGHVHTEDMTWFLQARGYWISYNRPFFQDVFNISGQPALVDKYGDHYSWNRTARAQIFRRLMPSVVDHASYQRAMRYNDFMHDPVGKQCCKTGPSASNAIAERGDLTASNADCISDIQRQDEAQIDVKYTTASIMWQGLLSSVAQSGPTYDTQPPFKWSSSPFAKYSHVGQPDLWKFPWVNVTWRYPSKHTLVNIEKDLTISI